jgi:homoserine O-acetyltransferase/O-succinyltransferase
MRIQSLCAKSLLFVLGCSSEPTPIVRAPDCSSPATTAASAVAPRAAATVTATAAAPAAIPAADQAAPSRAAEPEAEPPQLGAIGDLPLDSGALLRDCHVEYRILGAANADKSNVVVWATWFSGVTKDLVELVGPGKLVDSAKYQVVLVGALANGSSSSPSNSAAQPGVRFPAVTIHDMVESQHRLLTSVLGLSHVRAVLGISMGGMQAFQWGLSYPLFMDRLIPIVGSPRLAPYDVLLWQANLDAIEQSPDFAHGNYQRQPVLSVVQALADLNLTTPENYNRTQTRDSVQAAHATLGPPRFDANDRVRQLRAMLSHDVSKPFGGSLADAAKAVKARLLVVVNERDAMVTPGPALEFARLAGAPTLNLKGDCGHKAPSCETAIIGKRIAEFLK